MSSKIVRGDVAGALTPIEWSRLGGDSAQSMAPGTAGHGAARDANTTALEARITELQAQIAVREGKARQAGYREGEAAAIQTLETPLREALDRLAGHIGEMAGLRQRLRHESEEDIVKLAVAISRRVLRREITADPGAILGIVKAALENVDAREVFRIRVHPDDVPLLQSSLASQALPDKIEVVADRDLERGGLIIDTRRGSLDASVETQLAEIERGFTDLVRRSA